MQNARVIIIGASHAGAQLCASLRQEGWAGEIILIGDEPMLPYHRPPLSKTFLAGSAGLDDLLIRAPDFYKQQRITVQQGKVVAIDRVAHVITLADGSSMRYDKLALCLGARPRRLPVRGADLPGVHLLRNAADVSAIRTQLGHTRRAVIIGAGFIGLEAAASLRHLGIAVTVMETADRVLQRVTAPAVSAFYARVHREEGVDLRTGVSIAALTGNTRVRGVQLADGEVIPADLVIVGVGVEPNVALAVDAGLVVDNGIVIDAHGRTSDEDIVAAGDCASHPCLRYEGRLRLESVPNAGEHAKVAAATLCGKEKSISALPWFWSDQYDLKLQIAGLHGGHDDVVLRGDPGKGRSFACFYLRAGRLIAADCVNRPQEFLFSKSVITGQREIRTDRLSDESLSLSELGIC
ncbi:MAG TPA: FAD-dependent oxidoreductase [Moraxellaceae bacterium]|nr:FAD-dependent oxidoreductase [Moraxellaceae bacterium]